MDPTPFEYITCIQMLIDKLFKGFSIFLKKYCAHHIIFLNILVFQNGDTLNFQKGDEVIEQWIMSSENMTTDLVTVLYTTRSMVSENNKHFLYYEEWYYPASDSYNTKLTFYNAIKKKIWEQTVSKGRRISFHLSRIHDDIVTLVTTDNHNAQPRLFVIENKKMRKIIDDNKWYKLVSYSISPNMKYIALHIKNPYRKKIWDYVYFIDLKTKKEWSYVFPICVSCKRNKFDVMVDNDGITEVIYKGEHRIFSKQGKLTDIFIKL